MLDFKEVKPEVKEAKPKAVENDLVYVSIPLTDIYDYPHPIMCINNDSYKPGETYLVSKEVAGELERNMKRFLDECMTMMRPRQRKAVIEVAKKQGFNITQP